MKRINPNDFSSLADAFKNLKGVEFNWNLNAKLYEALGYLVEDKDKDRKDQRRFSHKRFDKEEKVTSETVRQINEFVGQANDWGDLLLLALVVQQSLTGESNKNDIVTAIDALIKSGVLQSQGELGRQLPEFALFQLAMLLHGKARELSRAHVGSREEAKKKGLKRPRVLSHVVDKLTASDLFLSDKAKASIRVLFENEKKLSRSDIFKEIGVVLQREAANNGHLFAKVKMGLELIMPSTSDQQKAEGVSHLASACEMIAWLKTTDEATNRKLDALYDFCRDALSSVKLPDAKLQLALLDDKAEASAADSNDTTITESLYKTSGIQKADGLAKVPLFEALVQNFVRTVENWQVLYRDDKSTFHKQCNCWATILFNIAVNHEPELLERSQVVTAIGQLVSVAHDDVKDSMAKTFLKKLHVQLNGGKTERRQTGLSRAKTMKPKQASDTALVAAHGAHSLASGRAFCAILAAHLTSPARLEMLDGAKIQTTSQLAFQGVAFDRRRMETVAAVIMSHISSDQAFSILFSKFKGGTNIFDQLQEDVTAALVELFLKWGEQSGSIQIIIDYLNAEGESDDPQATVDKLLDGTCDELVVDLDKLLSVARAAAIVADIKANGELALGTEQETTAFFAALHEVLATFDFPKAAVAKGKNHNVILKSIRHAVKNKITARYDTQTKRTIEKAITNALVNCGLAEASQKKTVFGKGKPGVNIKLRQNCWSVESVVSLETTVFVEEVRAVLRENFSGAKAQIQRGMSDHQIEITSILRGNDRPVVGYANDKQPTEEELAQQAIYDGAVRALKTLRFADATDIEAWVKDFLFKSGVPVRKFIGLVMALEEKISSLNADTFPDRLFWRGVVLGIFMDHADQLYDRDLLGPLARLILTTRESNPVKTVADAASFFMFLDERSALLPESSNDVESLSQLADLAHIQLIRNTKWFDEHRERETQIEVAHILAGEDIDDMPEDHCKFVRDNYQALRDAKASVSKVNEEKALARQLLLAQQELTESGEPSDEVGVLQARFDSLVASATPLMEDEEKIRDQIEEPIRSVVDSRLMLNASYVGSEPTIASLLKSTFVELESSRSALANARLNIPDNDVAEKAVNLVLDSVAADFDTAAFAKDSSVFQFKLEFSYDGISNGLEESIGEIRRAFIVYRQAAATADALRKAHRGDPNFDQSTEHFNARQEEHLALEAVKAPIRQVIYPRYGITYHQPDDSEQTATEMLPQMCDIIRQMMLNDNAQLSRLSDSQFNHRAQAMHTKMDFDSQIGYFMRAILLLEPRLLYTLHERFVNILQPKLVNRFNPDLPLSVNLATIAAVAQKFLDIPTGDHFKQERLESYLVGAVLVTHLKHIDSNSEHRLLTESEAFKRLVLAVNNLRVDLLGDTFTSKMIQWNARRQQAAELAQVARTRNLQTDEVMIAYRQANSPLEGASVEEESSDDDYDSEDEWSDSDGEYTGDEADDEAARIVDPSAGLDGLAAVLAQALANQGGAEVTEQEQEPGQSQLHRDPARTSRYSTSRSLAGEFQEFIEGGDQPGAQFESPYFQRNDEIDVSSGSDEWDESSDDEGCEEVAPQLPTAAKPELVTATDVAPGSTQVSAGAFAHKGAPPPPPPASSKPVVTFGSTPGETDS